VNAARCVGSSFGFQPGGSIEYMTLTARGPSGSACSRCMERTWWIRAMASKLPCRSSSRCVEKVTFSPPHRRTSPSRRVGGPCGASCFHAGTHDSSSTEAVAGSLRSSSRECAKASAEALVPMG